MNYSPDQTTEVRSNHRFDEAALGRYLEPRLEGFRVPFTLHQFGAGESNPTFVVRCDERSWVLRKKPPGVLLPTAHAVEREFEILRALADTDVPVAEAHHLCEDASVIGTPFYVMQYVEGRIFRQPDLPASDAAERRQVYLEMASTLARLHRVDPASVGLASFGKRGGYVNRQVARWTKQYIASKTDDVEDMDHLIAWLGENVPSDDRTTIVHGDYRLDNVVFDTTGPVILAVLDWELSTLGDPIADLAYNCMPYHLGVEGGIALSDCAERGTGIPTEAEYVDAYRRAAGLDDIPDWNAYLAFSFFRAAAIAQGVYKRGLQGNASSVRAVELGDFVRVASATGWKLARTGSASG